LVQSVFGAGYLFGVPSGANPTPVMFGAVQDTSVDFSFDLKALYGQSQFALEQARGRGKIDIKAAHCVGASGWSASPVLAAAACFALNLSMGWVRRLSTAHRVSWRPLALVF